MAKPIEEEEPQKKAKINHGGFNISEFAIKKPVSTVMMILTMMLLGVMSYMRLSVELFPNISFPIVVVQTTYAGSSSKEVETLISKPVEDAISSISQVKHIRSASANGLSAVIIEFDLGKDIKDASNEVREKVASIRRTLPEDIDEPTIVRVDPDSSAIINYIIKSQSNMSLQQLTDYVRDTIRPKLQQVDGVGSLTIVGGQEREVQVALNPVLLDKYNVTSAQVSARLNQENMDFPSGNIKTNNSSITIRTTNAFTTAQQVANLPIRLGSGKTVLLSDLGSVTDGVKEITSKAWVNGSPALVIAVQKQSGANVVGVIDGLNKQFEKMKTSLPSGMSIAVSFDTSKFIKESKDAAIDELVVGAILAVVVIFAFLRTIGGTLIAATAIPSSIISTFTVMYIMDFTLNTMSLLALSLVVGILVDDAVVDLENIYRKMEEGEDPYTAAVNATNEIGLAVVATTLSIVAVFVPVGFMSGIIGQFFKQFGLTVAVAVLVSLLVARTLTPTLAAYFLRPPKHKHDEHNVTGIAATYQSILAWSLNHRIVTVLVVLVVFIGSLPIAGLLPKGFVPKNDRDEFSIAVQMASGSTLNQTAAVLNEIAKRVSKDPIIKETLVTAGNPSGKTDVGSVAVTLKTKKEGRKENQFIIQDRLRKLVTNIPGALISFKEMRAVDSGDANYAMNLSLTGEDLDELQKIADKVVAKLHTFPIVTDTNTSAGTPQTEININVDHNKAAQLGVSASSIASTLRTATFGDTPSKMHVGNTDVDIRVRLNDAERYNLNRVKNLNIPTDKGGVVPLESISTIKFSNGPTAINRYDRERQILVYANTVSGVSIGDLITPVEEELKKMNLPPDIKYSFKGDAENMQEAFGNLLTALFLAVVFIYIILASQFENFAHPFTIMMALPLSFVGAFLGLFITNDELSMMSMIGIVMLMGLVTKNSILLVDYTITLRKSGMDRRTALLTAGPVRFRPIVMTTIAMIAGMTPLALRLTPGSEGRAPLAVAVIGGLLTSTVLSLVVIPVFYTLMDDLIGWLGRVFKLKLNAKPIEEGDEEVIVVKEVQVIEEPKTLALKKHK
ncbi:efflux RND transporter permease subunit [bacterium]|nr:MAG: efflux RND transporter permease subunit [bacterium]